MRRRNSGGVAGAARVRDPAAPVKNDVVNIHAIVDDTVVPHPEWQECRVDDNTGTSTGKCLIAG